MCGLITTHNIRASGRILPRDESVAPRLLLFEFQNWKLRQICTLIFEFMVLNVNEYITEYFTWQVNSFSARLTGFDSLPEQGPSFSHRFR